MPLSRSLVTDPSPEPARWPAATNPDRRAGRRVDLVVVLAAVALAFWVTSGLWADPNQRAITVNSSDQSLFEWLLAFGAHALAHGENPLFTYLINVPDGVNLAVNTSITVYAALFAPLTYLIGPPATFLVILTLNLAGTAIAWYWLLSRHVIRDRTAAGDGGQKAAGEDGRAAAGEGDRAAARVHRRAAAGVGGRVAAGVGALFIGFAPGMVSHANAHLNWTAGWLVPLLLHGVFRLTQPRRWLRNGILLGVLVAIAFSIAAEGLFFIALACTVFLVTRALHPARRAETRQVLPTFVRGLVVTGVVALALLAYPLWLHFFGPQRFHGTGFNPVIHAEDIAAYGAFPQRSLAGVAGLGTSLAPNPTEENSFFGLPLLALAVACFLLLWRRAEPARRATLRALAVTALVFTVLSWGPRVKIFGTHTGIPLPYALLGHLPVFNAALPSRLALVLGPVIGLLLAYTVDALIAAPPATRRVRVGWAAGFAVALLPLVPVSLLTIDREPVPVFITSGAWRNYVTPGGVLTPLPFTLDLTPDGQRWQAYALAHRQGVFAIPSGFFLGPGGPDGRGQIGPVPRATDALFANVAKTGQVPSIGPADRAAAAADLRYWRVQVVVLADRIHGAKFPVQHDAVLRAATELLGPPQRVNDVWLWRIR